MITASVCNAQDKQSKKTIAEKSTEMTEKLTKQVKLSEEQQTKVKTIYTSYLAKKKVLDNKKEELKKEEKKLKKERNIKLNKVLTEEQLKKKAALKKKKKSKKKK
jgi:hypothetical protein